jgi:hypothetical protein
MSKLKASPQSERGYDLCELLDKRITQAKGVCGAMMHMHNIDTVTGGALGALESLLDEAKKAFEELHSIYLKEHTPAEVDWANIGSPKEGS